MTMKPVMVKAKGMDMKLFNVELIYLEELDLKWQPFIKHTI